MSSSATPASKFSLTQGFLQRVLDSIAKPNDEERAEATSAVRKLQDRLLSTMKELDDLFVAMNPNFSLKGSVKKRLKVRQSDEFDFNLTLHLPLDESRWSEINVRYGLGKLRNPNAIMCAIKPRKLRGRRLRTARRTRTQVGSPASSRPRQSNGRRPAPANAKPGGLSLNRSPEMEAESASGPTACDAGCKASSRGRSSPDASLTWEL